MTPEQIRSAGLHNFHWSWIERNLGELWLNLISSQPNEKQWDLWNEFMQSNLGKAWEQATVGMMWRKGVESSAKENNG